jgi:hypothetical protein
MSTPFELNPGTPVVLYLHDPKEKIWGLLVSITAPGVVVRGIDLAVFDDWMRQEARGDEPLVGLATCFYPIHRLERLEQDETLGPILGYADRFLHEVGRSVQESSGFVAPHREPAEHL